MGNGHAHFLTNINRNYCGILIIGDILSTFLTQNLRNVVLATQTGILTILATFFKNLSLATFLDFSNPQWQLCILEAISSPP